MIDLKIDGQRSLQRIVAKLDLSVLSKSEAILFLDRLEKHFPDLFTLQYEIYGHRYDFFYHLQNLVETLLAGFIQRPKKLKLKDKKRQTQPDWFQQQNMLGMACYVDLFAGNLLKLKERIPYLKDLGITYLHLMPLYAQPQGDSDGGYAVSDYRQVEPTLGTTNQLVDLAHALEKAGISLVLDFVFNHTSDEHVWAEAAKAGDRDYQEYYYMFDDKTVPEQYEQHLREIFPQVRRGNFTWNENANKWVWTTFNNFQWDLNYGNPEVFNAITEEMLFLANLGCEVLRLDALAFIWKEMGTNCENQDKAHSLIQAFNACLRIAAPAVLFKSEAIVHPDEVLKYIDEKECQLSYNPLLMALIWESLATRETRLLSASMEKSFAISDDCCWVNYVRCHDDIGWTFDDEVSQSLGINPYDHRKFLNQFYTGRHEGSFSRGVAFAENPSNGDCRVCGSLASLTGLEQALLNDDPVQLEHAVKRILLVHSIILSIGGMPLLYSGDELGLLNDYSYENDARKAHDQRWVHRIPITDERIAQAKHQGSAQNKVSVGLAKMITARKQHQVFGHERTEFIDSSNPHVFAYIRANDEHRLLALSNFSEHKQSLSSEVLEKIGKCEDLLSGVKFNGKSSSVVLQPYQVLWLYA